MSSLKKEGIYFAPDGTGGENSVTKSPYKNLPSTLRITMNNLERRLKGQPLAFIGSTFTSLYLARALEIQVPDVDSCMEELHDREIVEMKLRRDPIITEKRNMIPVYTTNQIRAIGILVGLYLDDDSFVPDENGAPWDKVVAKAKELLSQNSPITAEIHDPIPVNTPQG
jgi:hypothetical protein